MYQPGKIERPQTEPRQIGKAGLYLEQDAERGERDQKSAERKSGAGMQGGGERATACYFEQSCDPD